LLDQIQNLAFAKGYSPAAASHFVTSCRRFILFHGKRHPKEMGKIGDAVRKHCSVKWLQRRFLNRHEFGITQPSLAIWAPWAKIRLPKGCMNRSRAKASSKPACRAFRLSTSVSNRPRSLKSRKQPVWLMILSTERFTSRQKPPRRSPSIHFCAAHLA